MGKVEFETGYLETLIAGLSALKENVYLDEIRVNKIRVYRQTIKTESPVLKHTIVIEEIEEE